MQGCRNGTYDLFDYSSADHFIYRDLCASFIYLNIVIMQFSGIFDSYWSITSFCCQIFFVYWLLTFTWQHGTTNWLMLRSHWHCWSVRQIHFSNLNRSEICLEKRFNPHAKLPIVRIPVGTTGFCWVTVNVTAPLVQLSGHLHSTALRLHSFSS